MTKRIAVFALEIIVDTLVTVAVTRAVDRLFFRKPLIGFTTKR